MVPPRSAFHPEERSLSPEHLRHVVQRDREAMDIFFAHFYDRVFAHVVNMTRDRTLAEDLSQDVFMRLHRVVDRLDPDAVRQHHSRAVKRLGEPYKRRRDAATP